MRIAPIVLDVAQIVAKVPRMRAPSTSGVGRGRGRGGKEPAPKLLKVLKPLGKRADFVRALRGGPQSIMELRKTLEMSRPQVVAYLQAIYNNHGIGYYLEGDTLELRLPKRATWKNIGV